LTDGSTLVKATSLSPVICTRLGTDTVIVMLPVDVAPSDP